jgi:hypothetical protein
MAAMSCVPTHAYAVADLPFGDGATDLVDEAGHLVPRHARV